MIDNNDNNDIPLELKCIAFHTYSTIYKQYVLYCMKIFSLKKKHIY